MRAESRTGRLAGENGKASGRRAGQSDRPKKAADRTGRPAKESGKAKSGRGDRPKKRERQKRDEYNTGKTTGT